MEKYEVGEIIRYLRKSKKMSQEKLSEGICSTVTISRIESGTQIPSERILSQLMDRLGSNLYKTSNTSRDMSFAQKENDINEISRLLDIRKFDEAKEKIKSFTESYKENKKLWDAKSEQEMLLSKIAIYLENKNETTDYSEIIKSIENTIFLTKPDMDFENFSDTPLTSTEINLLQPLLIFYYKNKQVEKSIRLCENLISFLEKNKNNIPDQTEFLLMTYLNYISIYEKEKQYDKCCDLLEKAFSISKCTLHRIYFSEFLCMKAKILKSMGKEKEFKHLMNSISPYIELSEKSYLLKKFELI